MLQEDRGQSVNPVSSTPPPSTSNEPGPIHSLLTFFFEPSTSHTLAVIRVFTGVMIAYIHGVWLLRLDDFFGSHALVDNEFWRVLHAGSVSDAKWNYLVQIDSLPLIRWHEIAALIAGVFVALGLFTRMSLLVAWFLTLMTVHRLTGFLFGLDQIAVMLLTYLCIAQSNSVLSLDRILFFYFPKLQSNRFYTAIAGLKDIALHQDISTWNNTLTTRLIQIHLCIIYLFGGLGKLRGEMWWDGSAMWFSSAAYEYQSLDLTWIGRMPILGALLTHITLFWEVSYAALIWPKWTRPFVLATAVLVHGGIACFLGMITFGWIMIVANLVFIPSDLMRRIYPSSRHSIMLKASNTELRNAPDRR